MQIVPGLRADLYTSHRDDNPAMELALLGQPTASVTTSVLPAIDPRLAVHVDLGRGVASVSTVGVTHQAPAFVVPIPGVVFVQPTPVLQTAFQMSQGIGVELPGDITAQATGFLHVYRDMTDLTATCPSIFGAGVLLGNAPGILNDLCLVDHVPGRAFGGEFLLRRSLSKRLSGWVAYTLSRSTREARPVGDVATHAIVETPASFDRTHVVNVVVAYDLGRDWHAGARFLAYSGLPYSQTRNFTAIPPYNDRRMPAFYRVDVRLEKRWKLAPTRSIALVFEGMNVTLNKEALGVHCEPSHSLGRSPQPVDTCSFETLGPVAIPSVGVEGTLAEGRLPPIALSPVQRAATINPDSAPRRALCTAPSTASSCNCRRPSSDNRGADPVVVADPERVPFSVWSRRIANSTRACTCTLLAIVASVSCITDPSSVSTGTWRSAAVLSSATSVPANAAPFNERARDDAASLSTCASSSPRMPDPLRMFPRRTTKRTPPPRTRGDSVADVAVAVPRCS